MQKTKYLFGHQLYLIWNKIIFPYKLLGLFYCDIVKQGGPGSNLHSSSSHELQHISKHTTDHTLCTVGFSWWNRFWLSPLVSERENCNSITFKTCRILVYSMIVCFKLAEGPIWVWSQGVCNLLAKWYNSEMPILSHPYLQICFSYTIFNVSNMRVYEQYPIWCVYHLGNVILNTVKGRRLV